MVLPDRIPFWQSSNHTPKRHLVALSMERIKLIEGVRLQLELVTLVARVSLGLSATE